jgi:hypothetical protein
MSTGGYYASGTGDRVNYMGNHNMVQEFGDEGESTIIASQGYPVKTMNQSNLNPGGNYASNLSQIPEQSLAYMTEPVDYGRDYYNLLRKIHQERTSCSNPTREELFSTFKILKASMDTSNMTRNKAANSSEVQSRAYSNPYEKLSKAPKISKETQLRLTGSEFKSKTDLASNKALSAKHDLVAGKDPDCVRYTIKMHHDEVNRENDLFRKEETFVLRRQREIKQKKVEEKIKKQRNDVRQKFVKSEMYQ